MKRQILILFVFSGIFYFQMASCKKSDTTTSNTIPLDLKIPGGWPQPNFNLGNGNITEQGFQLGRKLFYDGALSKDGNFPCASCHQQFAAFATFDHDFSHGFNNQFTTRNAPGLFNLAWLKEMHWDGGINHLEVQPLAPITAPNEMAEDINNVVNKLSGDSSYRQMFKATFGDETVNSQRMLKALSQFMAALISSDSKYDRVKQGRESFNANEQKGYVLFQANCAGCHQEPLFTDLSYRNNGLAVNSTINDMGRMKISGNNEDSLKFKVPSLRNLMLTFPYMHDGRFTSPMQVLDHYSDGITVSPTLDPLLRNRIAITYEEKFYLLDFLRTLTDTSFVNNPRFSQPQ